MKWKRNTGFDQIEDRRGQSSGGGLGVVLGGGGGGGGGIPIPIPGGKAGGGLGGIIVSSSCSCCSAVCLAAVAASPGWVGCRAVAARWSRAARSTPRARPTNSWPTSCRIIQAFWADDVQRVRPRLSRDQARAVRGSTQSRVRARLVGDRPVLLPGRPEGVSRPRLLRRAEVALRCLRRRLRDGVRRGARVRYHIQTVLGIAETSSSCPPRIQAAATTSRCGWSCRPTASRVSGRHSAQSDLESGDIEEALSAASAVGDDRIQESTTGRIEPESWTHGSAEQRVAWFTVGYRQRQPGRLRHVRPVGSPAVFRPNDPLSSATRVS